MENKQKFFKAKLNDTKKLISYTNNFKELLTNMENSFKINLIPLENSLFNISYIDEEEDFIYIESIYDFEEALKFFETSNKNYLNLVINQKNQSLFKKDTKENYEFIEDGSISAFALPVTTHTNTNTLSILNTNKSPNLKSTLQNDFLIPKIEKNNLNDFNKLNKIEKSEDFKIFSDEENSYLTNFYHMANKNIKKFSNEEIIYGKSPEISIDLEKQSVNKLDLKKNNFEIFYEKTEKKEKRNEEILEDRLKKMEEYSKNNKICEKVYNLKIENDKNNINYINNNNNKKKKQEKQEKIFNNFNNFFVKKKEIKEIKENKEIMKISKKLMKIIFKKEIKEMENEISLELIQILQKYYKDLNNNININNNNKANSIENSNPYSNSKEDKFIEEENKNTQIHNGFSCIICKQNPKIGIRYKCSVCKDYDICENCEIKQSSNHEHPFLKIRSSEVNPVFIKTITFEDNYEAFDNIESNYQTYNTLPNKRNDNNIEKLLNKKFDYNYFDIKDNDIIDYFNKNYNKKSEEKSKLNLIKKSLNLESEDIYEISCLNESDIFNIKISSNEDKVFLHKIFLKIKNVGKKTLPNLFYLKCISNSNEIKGKTVPINFILKEGMVINLEISLEISNLYSGIYLSVWRMQNTQGEFISDEIPLKIKIENDRIIKINSPINKNNDIGNNVNNKNNDKENNKENNKENDKENDKENERKSNRIISLEEFKKLKSIKQKKLQKNE
jgi:hypothetical protein